MQHIIARLEGSLTAISGLVRNKPPKTHEEALRNLHLIGLVADEALFEAGELKAGRPINE